MTIIIFSIHLGDSFQAPAAQVRSGLGKQIMRSPATTGRQEKAGEGAISAGHLLSGGPHHNRFLSHKELQTYIIYTFLYNRNFC